MADAPVRETADGFFTRSLGAADPELADAIAKEIRRQQTQIELIASENIVSRAVLEAQGSPLTNKYAEGYPGKRYYGGCEFVDLAEDLAIDRAKKLFGAAYANVQPNSGSQANQAVFLALLKPGDRILGLDLAAGGHLTHGARPNMSGKWFEAHHYGVREADALIDYDKLREQAREIRPQMIIAGGSAYPRTIDFAAFREIADEVGAYLLVDMAHFAGLVAGGAYPNPVPYADVCTTTTHKTLRGPRGGMIVSRDADMGKKFNSAVFPGLQGGPLMHVIAARRSPSVKRCSPPSRIMLRAWSKTARRWPGPCPKPGSTWFQAARTAMSHWSICAPRASRGTSPRRPWNAPTSPVTRMAFRSIRKSPRSPQACAWVHRPAPRAASGRRNSAASESSWETCWTPSASTRTATVRWRPGCAMRSSRCVNGSRSIRTLIRADDRCAVPFAPILTPR